MWAEPKTPQRIWVLKDAFLVIGAVPAVETRNGAQEESKSSPQLKACDEESSRDTLGQFLDASPGRQGTGAAGWCETFIAGWFLQH